VTSGLRTAALVSLATIALHHPATAAESRPLYALVIGNNEVPPSIAATASEPAVTLRYADDDAGYVYTFVRQMSRRALLLTTFDSDSQRRFPDLVADARPATSAEVDRAIATLREAMESDWTHGREPVALIFYSGHGVRNADGSAALALEDSSLDQRQLYDRVLAKLPAKFTHVLVDACHAEAVVRPRDVDARAERLNEADERVYLQDWTLARFPQVGAILASTGETQSFEWEPYHGGVFAHEVLSGLRGGADVNGDGRIEYSELAAFLAAANQRIADPRLRPTVVVQAPRQDGRATIVDLNDLRAHFRLTGRASAGWTAPFFVETDTGLRLADIHAEMGSKIALSLPAGTRLHVVRSDGEAVLPESEGKTISLDTLAIRRERLARDFTASSLQSGLFATSYGAGFYEGYVGQRVDLVPVPDLATESVSASLPADLLTSKPPRSRRTVRRAFVAGACLAAAVAGIAGAFMLYERHEYQSTDLERPATAARSRFDTDATIAGISGGVAAALGLTGTLLYALPNGARIDSSVAGN